MPSERADEVWTGGRGFATRDLRLHRRAIPCVITALAVGLAACGGTSGSGPDGGVRGPDGAVAAPDDGAVRGPDGEPISGPDGGPPARCVPRSATETACSDGVDDDCDGFVDCLDTECEAQSCTA